MLKVRAKRALTGGDSYVPLLIAGSMFDYLIIL